MRDPYANIAKVDPSAQRKLGESLEIRAADLEMRGIVDAYLAKLNWPDGMEVLEVGCGTGAVTRLLAERPEVKKVTGIDPSSIFVEKARSLNTHPHVEFVVGDGRDLPFSGQAFDMVVFHTVLGHMPAPERFLEEAGRVLRKGGQLAIFDGDYMSRSVAIREHDPLQACVDIMKSSNSQNPWLVRQLPAMLTALSFANVQAEGYLYVGKDPSYMLDYVLRGADRLEDAGIVSQEAAAALKAEARQRVRDGRFFGLFPYMSFRAIWG